MIPWLEKIILVIGVQRRTVPSHYFNHPDNLLHSRVFRISDINLSVQKHLILISVYMYIWPNKFCNLLERDAEKAPACEDILGDNLWASYVVAILRETHCDPNLCSQDTHEFTKTDCYHYFHCDCLARYIQFSREQEKTEEDKDKVRLNTKGKGMAFSPQIWVLLLPPCLARSPKFPRARACLFHPLRSVCSSSYCSWACQQSFFCLQLRPDKANGQHNGKWPVSLVYVSKPLISVITAIEVFNYWMSLNGNLGNLYFHLSFINI